MQPRPADYVTRRSRAIVEATGGPRPDYKIKQVGWRRQELLKLVPTLKLNPTDTLTPTASEVEYVIERLEMAERGEARRVFPKMLWSYDLYRHQGLTRMLRWERELLAELQGVHA